MPAGGQGRALGIASGPLLGGLLGNVSWRGPFFGVSVLMLIALVATVAWVPASPRPAQKSSLREPILALRDRNLARTSVTGLLYNWGFFTVLGYGQPGPVPVPGPIRMRHAGQSATVTSVPLTVTTAAGVDASRHRV